MNFFFSEYNSNINLFEYARLSQTQLLVFVSERTLLHGNLFPIPRTSVGCCGAPSTTGAPSAPPSTPPLLRAPPASSPTAPQG